MIPFFLALIWTSNKLPYFFNNKMDFSGASGANFRVLRQTVGAGSYLSTQTPSVQNRKCLATEKDREL